MTSTIGVERKGERRFLYHCPCGSNIATNEKAVTCANCGKTMEVQRVRKRRQRRNPEPSLWPLVFSTTTHRTRHRHKRADYHQLFNSLESPDYNERCLRVGFLILFSPLWVPLLWIFLSSIFAPLVAPLIPEQDRPHHYVKHNVVLHNGRGRALNFPTWERVDD